MHILFIDLKYHTKTKSADFFLSLLRSTFDVDVYYYDEMYKLSVPKELLNRADLVIVWQALLSRNEFVPAGKPCVYVPMYDSLWGSRAQWRRIARSGTKIISFCDAVTKMARCGGIPNDNLLELKYAIDPCQFNDLAGDPNVLAVWERGFFGLPEVKKIFSAGFFKKVILFRRPQPGLEFTPISDKDREDYNIIVKDSDYIPDDEYLALLREPGVYLAPRPKEGIGMSFLEQLAMGKCVIVHDDGTMNEYIRDGENGFVRNMHSPQIAPITHESIAEVRKRVRSSAMDFHKQWLAGREKIIPFLQAAAQSNAVKFGGFIDRMLRFAYLLEAALKRFTQTWHITF